MSKLESSVWYQKDNYTAYYTNGEGFIDYSEAEKRCEDLSKVEVFIHDSGMIATHNYPCPVCKTNHAVFLSSGGYFNVCRKCSEDGWFVGKRQPINKTKWWKFWKLN